MDIQTALIGGLTFVVCAGILLFISKFGMKEKSYEEALAEQRKRTTALLGTQKPAKPKEKKTKKTSKKVKEKQLPTTIESETAEESEETDNQPSAASQSQYKLHVEFMEPAIIEEPSPEEQVPNIIPKQKPGKKNKVRPILVHKSVENLVFTDVVEVVPANHFEQLHPKDEFELLHSHMNTAKDAPLKSELGKEKSKQIDVETDIPEKSTKPRKNSLEGKENKEKAKQAVYAKEKSNKEKLVEKQIVVEEVHKNKKQPKLETVFSHPVIVEEIVLPDIPLISASHTNGTTLNTNKEKKKKKIGSPSLHLLTGSKEAEVNLTLLLNAVRKAELSRSEVQILIDLLLNKQHEAPETLDEWSEGKADPIQKLKRQLAEKEKALAEEQEALAGAQAKLREIRSEQTSERTQLLQRNRGLEEALQAKHLELQAINSRVLTQNQKIQQFQAQLSDEAILLRNLREENTGLQLQRQQVDIHLAQVQEAEVTIQDLQSRNNQLAIELHTLTDQNMATKDHQQNVIVQLQHQINHFKGELDEKESINRQLDDLRRDLEHRLTMAHRIESELKHEISQLKSVCQQHAEEVRRLEHGKGQALEETRSLQKLKDELEHAVSQLKTELRDLHEENSELRKLRANGYEEENETHKAELLKLQNELSTTKSEVIEAEKQISTMKESNDSAIVEYKATLTKLETDLNDQKNKNNELRKKNWKVMDALKAAENKMQDAVKQPYINTDEVNATIRSEEQQTNIKFIQRLFPDMNISKNLPYYDWVNNAEKYIENYLKSLETAIPEENELEITKLQGQLQHYKAIIDDTEGILKKLQNHIEQEEILWRSEMRNKDLEIESIKKQYSSEITTKVQHLESQLNVEREAKQKLCEQYEQMKTSQSSAITANSAIIEKLTEEVNHLNQQLAVERSKSIDVTHTAPEVNDSINKLENSSSNGPLLRHEETK